MANEDTAGPAAGQEKVYVPFFCSGMDADGVRVPSVRERRPRRSPFIFCGRFGTPTAGSWLGMARGRVGFGSLKTAKHGDSTACTALYRFRGGLGMGGGRWERGRGRG